MFTNTKPEQSYDISPYKVSDDEDEDEDDDDAPNSKFVPSWAGCVTQIFCVIGYTVFKLSKCFNTHSAAELSCNGISAKGIFSC